MVMVELLDIIELLSAPEIAEILVLVIFGVLVLVAVVSASTVFVFPMVSKLFNARVVMTASIALPRVSLQSVVQLESLYLTFAVSNKSSQEWCIAIILEHVNRAPSPVYIHIINNFYLPALI